MTGKIHIFDPTGNITVLAECARDKAVADRVMKEVPTAQQVGFVTDGGKTLTMTGGEFCGNASMCAAVLNYEKTGERELMLRVSGTDEKTRVLVEKKSGGYFCTVTMPPVVGTENVILTYGGEEYRVTAVRMQGIIHLIMRVQPEKEKAERAAKEWCRMLSAEALGLMFLDMSEKIKLTPLVYVPGADTLFWESSCASGTSAVGVYLREKSGGDIENVEIKEPAGSLFVTATQDGKMKISGNVRKLR